MRIYRTAKGVWGFGFGGSPSGWHVHLACWVFTTEPE